MYASVRPMNRSTTSASVIAQPSCASTATSTRTAMRSLSTSTPSQSKITSRMELLEVPDLLGLAVRPTQEREPVPHVPERHEMRPPSRPGGREGQQALLVEEANQLRVGHGDVVPSGRHRQYPWRRSTTWRRARPAR